MNTARQDGIDAVIDLLTRLATGDLDARGERRNDDEELDAIVFGINMLAEELSVHRAELEHRVQIRTAELEVARQEAMDASRIKSEFLAAMSHEIRTPMNGVIGLTKLLAETEMVGVQGHYVDGLQRAGDALLGVINDILDFSKLEAGKVVLDRVDFDPRLLLERTASLMAMPASTKQLELIASCSPEVPSVLVGDDGRLGQILLNLTANAVKFTEKGEVVLTARLSAEDAEGAWIRFEVTDTGIGVGEDAQRNLFAPFSQADASTTRRFGGSGLGLAISRGLCEVMGGSIGVESQEGVGSTFWFEVPLQVATRGRPYSAHHDLLEGQRVLVADGNRSSRLFLESQLLQWAMRPTVVANAREVLPLLRGAALADDPFRVALLDPGHSEIDGWQLAAAVAADASLAGTRLLLMSRTIALDPARPTLPGGGELLLKPILVSELFDRLVTTLTRTSALGLDERPLATLGSEPSSLGRVLVVEDNEVNQMVAEGLVERLGYDVDIVGNGVEALEAAVVSRYVAILMDCQMPVMDGYSATAEIRRLEGGGERVPIIAMTAGVTLEERQRCLVAGMDAFVAKPVDPDVLREVLAHWARSEAETTPTEE